MLQDNFHPKRPIVWHTMPASQAGFHVAMRDTLNCPYPHSRPPSSCSRGGVKAQLPQLAPTAPPAPSAPLAPPPTSLVLSPRTLPLAVRQLSELRCRHFPLYRQRSRFPQVRIPRNFQIQTIIQSQNMNFLIFPHQYSYHQNYLLSPPIETPDPPPVTRRRIGRNRTRASQIPASQIDSSRANSLHSSHQNAHHRIANHRSRIVRRLHIPPFQ